MVKTGADIHLGEMGGFPRSAHAPEVAAMN